MYWDIITGLHPSDMNYFKGKFRYSIQVHNEVTEAAHMLIITICLVTSNDCHVSEMVIPIYWALTSI